MTSRTRAMYVGLFVMVGTVLALGALIWLGASDWFAETRTFATYYTISVQGLNIEADVKFRGVTVGKVREVGVAPDGYLIEVVMELNPEFAVTDSLRASLTLTGITGMKYVELDYVGMEHQHSFPELRFESEYDVIPYSPGDFEEIEQSLRSIYAKLVAIDTEGISYRAKQFLDAGTEMMREADTLINNDDLTKWATNLDATILRADSLMMSFDLAYHDAQIDSALMQVVSATTHFHNLLVNLDEDVSKLRMSERADSMYADVRLLVQTSTMAVARSQNATMQQEASHNTEFYNFTTL